MKPKRYTSFSEIDADLRILRLQKEIDLENLKLKYHTTKNSLYPAQLFGGLGGIAKKIAISMITKMVLKKLR